MADSTGFGRQAIAGTADIQHTISYDVTNFTTGTSGTGVASLRIGTAAGLFDILNQSIPSNGSKSHNFTPTTATFWIEFYIVDINATTGASYEVDNVSIPSTIPITITEGGFAQLISGSAANWEVVRAWLFDIGFIRDPYKTPILSDLEKEYGVFTDTGLTETERRDKLAAVKYARAGTGTIDDLQTALDRAFPDVGFVVYNNCPAQDPASVVSNNLALDGDMEQTSATPPWVVGNSATLTKDVTAPKVGLQNLRITRNAVNDPYAEQVGIMNVGEEYRFLGWAKSDGSAVPQVIVAGQVIWTGTTATTWQLFDVTDTTISSGTLRLTSDTSTGVEYTEWDNVSVTKTGVLIVNGQLFSLYVDYIAGAGELAALCGQPSDALLAEPGPLAGDNNGIVKNLIEYTLPTDPKSWPLIFFVGGQARYYSLLIDGNMDRSDVAAWSVGNGAALSKKSTDPKLGPYNIRVTKLSTLGDARQTILTIGNDYRVIGWARTDGVTVATIRDGGGLLSTVNSTSWTKVDFEFTAAATTFELGKTSAGTWAEFDDFQVIPLGVQINQMEAGEALAQCGEPLAYAGAYSSEIISIDSVSVSEDRQDDLERLILAIKPMHSWCLLFVDYT